MRLTSCFTRFLVLVIPVGLALAPSFAGTILTADKDQRLWPGTEAQTLHDGLRVTFEDQIFWTRVMATAVLRDLKGEEVYRDRLMANCKSFEQLLSPYYKEDAGKLVGMLVEHVELTEKVFFEMRAGGGFQTVLRQWYANADDIATTMGTLNPKYWPGTESQLLWRTYLDNTLWRSLAQLRGDWRSEVAEQDDLHRHTLDMSDFMSDGILRQFSVSK